MAQDKIRLAVLGAGGLGRAAAQIIAQKSEARLVAICDSEGYAYSPDGLDLNAISQLAINQSVAHLPKTGASSPDPIGQIIKLGPVAIDGVFVALPNLPNEFIPNVIRRFIQAEFDTVFTDALKRTAAMELLFQLDGDLKKVGATYITGAGATPGLLTAAAVIAAQSFVEVHKVHIWWGVGIANWEQYRGTVREDIAHLPGYSVERAKGMSDAEVEALLSGRGWRLELHQMEHADDLLLEMAGVVDDRKKVEVGGIIDTRNPQKPVSTTLTLTGRTHDGKVSSHRFVLGDETSMAANVVGPALGYLKRALWFKDRGICGILGSTDCMPMVLR